MARLIEDQPGWPLYQIIIKELAQNKCLDLTESQWKKHLVPTAGKEKDGSPAMRNELAAPLGHLARPDSHRARVRVGLTVEEGRHWKGAVLRIGLGKYIWDPDIIITGQRHDTLISGDPDLAKYNTLWLFRKPPERKEDKVEVTEEATPPPTESPAAESASVEAQPTTSATVAEVLALKGDRIVLNYQGQIITATITEAFG